MDLQIAPNSRNVWQQAQGQAPQQEEEVEVYVLFVNKTNRIVDLYWRRPRETENMQYTLKPYEEVRVNTYNTHKWFFCDWRSGERMHVQFKEVFSPVRIRVPRDPQRPEELCDVRIQVIIHFPLRTLKENCLWSIAKRLKRTCNAPQEYICNYMIPTTLKHDLRIILRDSDVYCRLAMAHRVRISRVQ